MAKLILIGVLFASLLVVVGNSRAADRWQERGTLQGAYVGQWKMAAYTDKLATAADWILARPRIKDKTVYRRIIENIRPVAFELVQCVDRYAADEGFESNRSAADLASDCMISKGW